jgi:hypothetical protein
MMSASFQTAGELLGDEPAQPSAFCYGWGYRGLAVKSGPR